MKAFLLLRFFLRPYKNVTNSLVGPSSQLKLDQDYIFIYICICIYSSAKLTSEANLDIYTGDLPSLRQNR